VLPLLDGTRTKSDVGSAVAAALAEGRLAPTESGRPPEGHDEPRRPDELADVSLRRILGGCYILR